MHNTANTVLWIYIILLLVGGLFGFFKGKSKISLTTSVVFAVLLILTTLRGIFDPAFANILANVVLLCCWWCSPCGWRRRKNSCRAA